MDLIQIYDSDSSLDEFSGGGLSNYSNVRKRKQQEHRKPCTTLKRYKDDENSDDEESNQNPICVTLLESPFARGHDRHRFKRNQEHIQGNWAGHVFMKIPCNAGNERSEQEELLHQSLRNTLQYFQQAMDKSSPSLTTGKDYCDSTEKVVIVPYVSIRVPTVQKDNNELEIQQSDDLQADSSDSGSELSQSVSDEASASTSTDEKEPRDHQQALHISLSRQFYLQKQSIHPFLSDLKQRIQIGIPQAIYVRVSTKNCNGTCRGAHQQSQRIMDMEILSNDEKTRSFLTVPVTTCGSEISSVVALVDSTMKKYGQKEYYEDPKFHISIASWKYSKALVERWQRLRGAVFESRSGNDLDHDSKPILNANEDTAVPGEDVLLFALRGIYCDFGTVENHYIPFGKI